LFQVGYVTDLRNNTVELSGEPVEVRRLVAYKPVTNGQDPEPNHNPPTPNPTPEPTPNEGSNVDKEQLINWLVTNCNCYKGANGRKPLEQMHAPQLTTIKLNTERARRHEEVHNAAIKGYTDGHGNNLTYNPEKNAWEYKPATPSNNQADGQNPPPNPAPANNQGNPQPAQPSAPTQPSMEDWLKMAPPEAKSVWNTVVQSHQQQHAALVEHVVNAQATTDEAKAALRPIYQGMGLAQLQTIANVLPRPGQPGMTPNGMLLPGYVPPGGVPPQTQNQDEDVLLLVPSLDFAGISSPVFQQNQK